MQNEDTYQILGVEDAALAYAQQPNPLRLIYKSREGISRQSLNHLAKDMRRSVQELAEILPSSYSTLTKKNLFDKSTSEHILLLKALYEYGIDVFGNVSRFNSWLDTPVGYFDNATLYSLLDTSFGIDLVKQELAKIDLGMPF